MALSLVCMRAQAYNMQADGLQLIPASAKRAAGIQYEIHLDRAGVTASELIDVDIKASPPALLTASANATLHTPACWVIRSSCLSAGLHRELTVSCALPRQEQPFPWAAAVISETMETVTQVWHRCVVVVCRGR